MAKALAQCTGPVCVHITDDVSQAIERDARRAYPKECCGLLSGSGDLITHSHPLKNTARRPETSYFAAPEELFAVMRTIREQNRLMMGIYHSHPTTRAYPSSSDVRMAFYPEAIYFIISLEREVDLRAFRIVGSEIENVAVSLVGRESQQAISPRE